LSDSGLARIWSRSAALILARRGALAARLATLSQFSPSTHWNHFGAAQLTSIAASVAAMAETRPGGALAGPWTSRLRLGNQVFTEMRRTAAPARAR